jgi:hypothetical protein
MEEGDKNTAALIYSTVSLVKAQLHRGSS